MRAMGISFVAVMCGCVGSTDSLPSPNPAPGSNATGSNEPGSNAPHADDKPNLAAASPLELEIVAELNAKLDDAIGQFVSGRTPIYRGSISARDNLGSIQAHEDGVMSDAEVVGSLETRTDVWTDKGPARGMRLLLVSDSQAKMIDLAQLEAEPSVTRISMILPLGVGSGLPGTCTGCIASFDASPPSFAVDPVVALGKWGDGSPLRVSAHGQVSKVASKDLVFSDLIAASRVDYERFTLLSGFTQGAGEHEKAISGERRTPTPVPMGASYDHCELVTSYNAELYVGDNPVQYGVRAFSAKPTQTCCTDRPAQGCEVANITCF